MDIYGIKLRYSPTPLEIMDKTEKCKFLPSFNLC